jgi:hypothetical protein
MNNVVNCIRELLSSDMLSHGLLLQTVEQLGEPSPDWKAVLSELLTEDIEIGEAKLASPDYVEFIAWKGTIKERVMRAAKRVEGLAAPDREFAYWLALRKNVDRFEGTGAGKTGVN